MLLSIVIPVYNEARTLGAVIAAVRAVPLPLDRELIVVDDGSTDGTRELLGRLQAAQPDLRVLAHAVNRGKGAALRAGFRAARGDLVLIQDADLEYDPRDLPALLAPLLEDRADVVFGSRFRGGGAQRAVFFWHAVGNRVLTLLANLLTDLNLTDMEVGYKAFRRAVLAGLSLQEDRFGIEPELTVKAARGGWRLYEVPVSYYGRDYAAGKKVTWKDGVRALWCLVKYRFG